jgi:hypothetical protein
MGRGTTVPHFDKHQGTVGSFDDQIYFTTTAPRRPIIALHELQALCL